MLSVTTDLISFRLLSAPEDCHAINYYVLFAFSCDLDNISCHCRVLNQSNENTRLYSLRSWRYCVGARLKFWQRSRVPKKGSRDEAVDGSAATYYSTTIQYRQLRRLEAVRLYELTSGLEFHEVDASLAKTVNNIKY